MLCGCCVQFYRAIVWHFLRQFRFEFQRKSGSLELDSGSVGVCWWFLPGHCLDSAAIEVYDSGFVPFQPLRGSMQLFVNSSSIPPVQPGFGVGPLAGKIHIGLLHGYPLW